MKTIEWKDGKVFLIDQRKLPLKYEIINCSSVNSPLRFSIDSINMPPIN